MQFVHQFSGYVLVFVLLDSTVETSHSCDSKDQVTEIKAKVRCHSEQNATVQGQAVLTHTDAANERDVQLSKHKRQIRGGVSGSCEEALETNIISCEEELQAKDQKIKELQQTITSLRADIEQLQKEKEYTTRLWTIPGLLVVYSF